MPERSDASTIIDYVRAIALPLQQAVRAQLLDKLVRQFGMLIHKPGEFLALRVGARGIENAIQKLLELLLRRVH